MTTHEPRGSALHRAALSLHSLAAEDRDWILGALRGSDSDRLRGLLRELQDLGIPAEGVPLKGWIDGDGAAMRDPLPSLAPAATKELARLLAAEPPRVRNVLLAGPACGWGHHLPGWDGPEAAASVPDADRAPALQIAVVGAIRRRLEAIAGPDASGGRGLWRRIAVHFARAGTT